MAELSSQPASIQSLYSWYAEGKLIVNRRYQRKLVWTLNEKQRLIESLLKKYPIPAILIAERKNEPGTYEIIDGLQRLHAIVSFIEHSFTSIDDKIFNLQFFPTAKSRANKGIFKIANKTAKSLSQEEVSTLLDYALALSIMRGASEAEINDVFSRINTYGHRLSDQERRQAGVQNIFSELVRNTGCALRGDVSTEIVQLKSMPAISIDSPSMKHGYEIKSEDVFWVRHGILRSTDLRDSMDEQCLADIAASIASGQIVERSKEMLDRLYSSDTQEADQLLTALKVYGAERLQTELCACIDEILKVCEADQGGPTRLRELVFNKQTTNPFPSVFSILVIAFHELLFKDAHRKIIDHSSLKSKLTNIGTRITTGKKSTSPEERSKNVESVKGIIANYFVTSQNTSLIYGCHGIPEIEALIRRSEAELPDYELKQGCLTLGTKRTFDKNITTKVAETICAMANNGPNRIGKIIIGVTDKDSDAKKIESLDKVKAYSINKRKVVGVTREAKILNKSTEAYLALWKDAIKNSELTGLLRDSVLSSIDYNDFYGLGVIIITVPPQKTLSWLGEETFRREGDSTVLVKSKKEVAQLAERFSTPAL